MFAINNSCTFVGRLGKSPKDVGNGRILFSIAVNDLYDKDKKKPPSWVPLIATGSTGEYVSKNCDTGTNVMINCKFTTYKKKDGTDSYIFEVNNVMKLADPNKERKPPADNEGGDDDFGGIAGDQKKPPKQNSSSKAQDSDFDVPF